MHDTPSPAGDVTTDVLELLPAAVALGDLAVTEHDGISLESRCGRAVLLVATVGLTKARVLQRTRTYLVDSGHGASSRFYIVPIRTSDGSRRELIRVGRAASNDIVITDVTLSKLHAFFRESPAGFSLEDGGSKNGTFVEDQRVPARGDGPAVRLASPATVRFGSVRVQYLSTPDLRIFMRRLSLSP